MKHAEQLLEKRKNAHKNHSNYYVNPYVQTRRLM